MRNAMFVNDSEALACEIAAPGVIPVPRIAVKKHIKTKAVIQFLTPFSTVTRPVSIHFMCAHF